MKSIIVITILLSLGSCSTRTVIREDFFNYPYEKVFDYYVINAWRDLGETLPAYTPEMVESHSRLLGKLPWVNPVPSADKKMVIGMTPGWPKNPAYPDDPEIPPQKIFGYQVTDPGPEDHKLKIILTSGNHSTEFTGNWVLEGMVNFIAGDDPEAKFLRQKAIFYVYPDVNPEGRYQAVHRINLQAAPDPNAGTDMRKRGNPELYAAGEGDHNRIWNTRGKFSTIDIITASMIKDTGGEADYLWDMHGPQTTGNWRTPSDEARTNAYAEALLKREPDIVRCGPESGFKVNVAKGPEGKIGLYVLSREGQRVQYPYVYEPGGWSRERLMESGRNIALAFYDILNPDRSVRLIKTINSDWVFNYLPFNEPDTLIMSPSYDDSRWQAVALPHTWSVYETTGEVHPFIYNASERDDPYWWYGWGYYRKRFFIDKSLADKKVFIEFDGVQKYSRIYLNGHYIGDHKGGFTSFYFDITDHISWDGGNVLAVAVSNRRNDSHRIPPMNAGNWNVYGGIYRDVRLVVKNRVHIPFQGSYKHEGGTFVTTPRITKESADVRVVTWVKNEQENGQKVKLKTTLKDTKGNVIKVLTDEREIDPGRLIQFDQMLKDIREPVLWSPENPYLYSVKSEIFVRGELVDEYESPLGFRYFNWDYENDDLYVNGEKMNIRGTNRHQEYPWLGDAHPKWIARMDMYDIKYNLGHNFMRLTHYPNDKYLYQLADSFGLVMVEEVPNIKSIDFDEDVQRQNVLEMIRRDRNHPSIFFWSVGNETTDAADSKWAFEEDTTRIIHLRKGEQGGDYVEHTHGNLDMENLLRVTVRGWFDEDDAPEGIDSTPENGQHSSNETWQHRMAMARDGSVRGLLGDNCVAWLYEDHGADREYKNCILKHINPKGWVDMYRQPKYIYWLTKANYTGIPTVFIHPHFWRRRYLGQKKDIQVDSNCTRVELFVNGKSAGVRYPDRDSFNTVTFKDILIEEGTILAKGTRDGCEFFHEVSMPGDPAKIVLESEQREIAAGRSGIAIVTANLVDIAGNPVFDANNTLHWKVEGPGKLVGPPDYVSDINKSGEMGGTGYTVVPVSNVIRSGDKPGRIKVTVSSEGLAKGELIINSVAKYKKADWLIEPELSDEGRKPVRRDSSFFTDVLEVPLTIFPVDGNHVFEGKEPDSLRKQAEQFIAERNYGKYDNFSAYKFLLDALVMKLVSMNGYMVADDYNFLIGQYNELVVAEGIIEKKSGLSPAEKEKLKEDLAHSTLIKGNQIDPEKIKIK